MITREMIKKGFKNGIISIEDDYAGCMGICCKIGENAKEESYVFFRKSYFGGHHG